MLAHFQKGDWCINFEHFLFLPPRLTLPFDFSQSVSFRALWIMTQIIGGNTVLLITRFIRTVIFPLKRRLFFCQRQHEPNTRLTALRHSFTREKQATPNFAVMYSSATAQTLTKNFVSSKHQLGLHKWTWTLPHHAHTDHVCLVSTLEPYSLSTCLFNYEPIHKIWWALRMNQNLSLCLNQFSHSWLSSMFNK